ncbi:MAG: ribonuclease H-like domain-containing protein [Myxococcaceae bacterium]|nr:ribonuclease H-like domain-containing protein [Myxococcaceae bacterium]
MDFKTKLGLLARPVGSTPIDSVNIGSPPVGSAPRREPPLSALIPPTPTAAGALHVVQTRSPSPEVPDASTLGVLGLDESLSSLDPSRVLFLDTETTGLSGGAGTLPFLVGLAFVEAGELVVEQLHLSGPGAERPVLARLSERVEAASALISFNGRSFDWPLLRTRFVMNRLTPPAPRPHLDLLHASRRVLRHWQRETRLATVEAAVLDVHRVGDLDGAQVPAAWFDFLRTGRVATLSRVLSHNLQDLRSTAALLRWLGASWSELVAVPPEVSLGLGEVAERARLPFKAERFFERATSSAVLDVQARALVALGRVQRRRGALDQAAAAWERAVPLCEDASMIHLALARLYEHRLRDAHAAERHALLARRVEAPMVHARRVARLSRKRQLVLAMR